MTDGFTCTDKDTLVAYLYGECEAAERRLVEAHLATCKECAGEVAGFAEVRMVLASWEIPDHSSGVRIVSGDAEAAVVPAGTVSAPAVTSAVLRPRRWWQAPLPALGRLAAAILLFAGGAAIANLEVRYDQDGLVVRTGWRRQSVVPATQPSEAQPVPAAVGAAGGSPWRTDLVSLEQRLREDFAGVPQGSATQGAAQARPALDESTLLQRVSEMIASSEQRQQREMAVRMTEMTGELAAQRHNDLLRVQQGLGQLEGTTGAEVMQQRQLINYLLTVSQRR